MVNEELPLFIQKGTFTWTRYGYHFPEPPEIDLLAPEALASNNPWIIVAAILERAKAGDHSLIHTLKQWFHAPSPMSLDRVCMLITGDAGTAQDVLELRVLMEEGPDDARVYACIAAADAGYLWLAPYMLEAWHRLSSLGDHEMIGYAISDLLEVKSGLEDMGPIAERAGSFDVDTTRLPKPTSPAVERLGQRIAPRGRNAEFDRLVRAKFDEVRGQLGTDKVPVWRGKLYGVTSFAHHLYSLVRSSGGKPSLWGSFIPLRRKFEAATGINCSGFFEHDVFQPLAAAAILEDFLDSPESARYQEGVRYFFGHRIPD